MNKEKKRQKTPRLLDTENKLVVARGKVGGRMGKIKGLKKKKKKK